MTSALVVDDSAMDRRLAGKLLEEDGWTVSYANNGKEALAHVRREVPDLLLTDLQMPEMDGLELVQEIQKGHPALPVILMTAHGSEELAVRALRTGAASYVPKKSLGKDLQEVVRAIVGLRRETREKHARVLDSFVQSESQFVLDNDTRKLRPLIEYFQDDLRQVELCKESELVRIGTALHEALVNAIEHGNLELDSRLREGEHGEYFKLAAERVQQAPYRDRRVVITNTLTREKATYTVRDEGPGFDPYSLPDPTDPANLDKASGRGLLLIRIFMDEVRFNDSGNELTMVKHREAVTT